MGVILVTLTRYDVLVGICHTRAYFILMLATLICTLLYWSAVPLFVFTALMFSWTEFAGRNVIKLSRYIKKARYVFKKDRHFYDNYIGIYKENIYLGGDKCELIDNAYEFYSVDKGKYLEDRMETIKGIDLE